MGDAFDPYYIWLGIPPDDQPPNHYRLLGIELFEASGEVIEAAANRQMAYMQEISAGDEHIDEAQKILGELSRARVCLLSADKKKAYDAELQASFDSLDRASEEQDADQGTQTPAVASPRDRDKSFLPAQTEDDEGDRAPVLGTHAPRVKPTKKHRTATRNTTRKKKKKQDATVPILMGLGAAMLFIVFLVVVLNSTGSESTTGKKSSGDRKEKVAKGAKNNLKKPNKKELTKTPNQRRSTFIRRKSASQKRKATLDKSNTLEGATAAFEAREAKAAQTGETASEAQQSSTAERTTNNTTIAKTEPDHAQARESLNKLGLVEQNHAWWTKQVYEDAQKLKEQDAVLSASISPDESWSSGERDQIKALLELRQRIQINLNAKSSNPEVKKLLKILNQPLGTLPKMAMLDAMARGLLRKNGLEEKDGSGSIWQHKDQTQRDQLVAQANQSASKMPANIDEMTDNQRKSWNQRKLIEIEDARNEYWQLHKKGRDLGRQNGATFGLWGQDKIRFYFLGEHHPGIGANQITSQKKDPKLFFQEIDKAVWGKVRNTPAWKEVSANGKEAVSLNNRILKAYKSLCNNESVTIALQVVQGEFPPEACRND